MVITFLRNVGHRLKEICIFWQQLKRQGDYTDQLARFRQAEMLNAKGNDGQSHRQPYRGEVISIADAGGNTVAIRCGMVATFGGMWREVVAVSIALV
jgi:hypothetical protein